jgi:hypothetical protein
MRERFVRVAKPGGGLTYAPNESLSAERLLGWLGK